VFLLVLRRSVNDETRQCIGLSTSNGPPMFASSVEITFNLLSKLLAKFANALRNESLILYTDLTGRRLLEIQLTLGFGHL